METQSISNNSSEDFSDIERWGSLISGGALVLAGLSQRSLRGVLIAIAGGTLAYHGVAGQKNLQDIVTEATGINHPLRVEKTVTIQNKSAAELYQFWRNLANLPTFMEHLKSVTMLDNTRAHWIANAPLANTIEWDAQIISDRENSLISWASVAGADVENSGFVRFKAAPLGRGTEVKVVLEYSIPGGIFTAAIARLFGENPEQQIGNDLRRFKMLMETGEFATTEGQSSGARM
jgi:uncharacterized membrane protein